MREDTLEFIRTTEMAQRITVDQSLELVCEK